MIYSINYADEGFEKARKYNSKTAYSKGKVDKVLEYYPHSIDKQFRKKNDIIFSYKRGAGLWLWKPYIIQKAIQQLNEGDYLFYCDAGAVYVNEIGYLIDCMERNKQSIMLFEIPLLSRQFTKRETFHLMDYHNYEDNQVLAGYILLKKSKFSELFLSDWLKYCEDERILSPKHFLPEIQEFDDFIAHREDQSILSILTRKYNLPVFRDPSDFGDRPWQYASNKWSYNPKLYSNSTYPKIIISNRKEDPMIYKYKEKLKTILNRMGLYSQEYYFKKYNIEYNVKKEDTYI